jgi:hypothetical protein
MTINVLGTVLDIIAGSGIRGSVKKQGGGGKFTWGAVDDLHILPWKDEWAVRYVTLYYVYSLITHHVLSLIDSR